MNQRGIEEENDKNNKILKMKILMRTKLEQKLKIRKIIYLKLKIVKINQFIMMDGTTLLNI